MGRKRNSTGGTKPGKNSSCCSSRKKKAKGKAKTKMGRRRDGGCQEVGGEKLEEWGKEYGQLAEASKEGLGSKKAVVPMMMVINTIF